MTERILLQTLNFDLTLEHPYKPLLAYVKSIGGTRSLAQVAWNYINDSLRTTICLDFIPRFVAAAAFLLAAQREEASAAGGKLPSTAEVYEAFQVDSKSVQIVMQRIQNLYKCQGNNSKSINGGYNADSATNQKVASSDEKHAACPPSPASTATYPLEDSTAKVVGEPLSTDFTKQTAQPLPAATKQIAPDRSSQSDGAKSRCSHASRRARPR